MIGHIHGKVLFSDGKEAIILTAIGVGYQVHFNGILTEGSQASLYISHVIKENSEELYGFKSLREKKMFELLTSVKGVGPKSAYSLLSAVSIDQIIDSVTRESKTLLVKAPGVGPRAAAQIILDLSNKIHKIKIYSAGNHTVTLNLPDSDALAGQVEIFSEVKNNEKSSLKGNSSLIIDEALLACKELGFKQDIVEPMIFRFLETNEITRPEQLVHLVLKEL